MRGTQPLQAAKACFISYRHTRNEDAQRYVQAFVRQLRKNLSFELPNVPIFFDEDGIKVGTQFHDELAFQLHRSACLVIFFSPQHFDSEYVYCALEYQAMVRLEKQRRELYAEQMGNMSLILPVVFRGREHLPQEIEARTPLDFTHIIVESDLGAALLGRRFFTTMRPAHMGCRTHRDNCVVVPADDGIACNSPDHHWHAGHVV